MKQGLKIFFTYLFMPIMLLIVFNGFYNNYKVLAEIIFYLLTLILFFILSRKEIWNDLKSFKNNFKKYLPTIFIWLCIGFGLMIVSNYIIGMFVDGLPSNEVNNRELLISNPLIMITYLLIIAPMLEEYVFRFGFKNIKNYYFFTFFTSLLFASLHILSIEKLIHLCFLIPYFCLSFGFSNIYYKTKNYWAAVIAHMIHNLLTIIIILVF